MDPGADGRVFFWKQVLYLMQINQFYLFIVSFSNYFFCLEELKQTQTLTLQTDP